MQKSKKCPFFIHFFTQSIMGVFFQQPFTERAYAEVKEKESRAAQKKATKQLPSKQDDAPTFAPSRHAVLKEPVIDTNFRVGTEEPTSHATNVDLASDMFFGAACCAQKTTHKLTYMQVTSHC